jgi:hypothetical protein
MEDMRTRLHNINRREKRAKLQVEAYLKELVEQRQLSEKAQEMLEAYKGIFSKMA